MSFLRTRESIEHSDNECRGMDTCFPCLRQAGAGMTVPLYSLRLLLNLFLLEFVARFPVFVLKEIINTEQCDYDV